MCWKIFMVETTVCNRGKSDFAAKVRRQRDRSVTSLWIVDEVGHCVTSARTYPGFAKFKRQDCHAPRIKAAVSLLGRCGRPWSIAAWKLPAILMEQDSPGNRLAAWLDRERHRYRHPEVQLNSPHPLSVWLKDVRTALSVARWGSPLNGISTYRRIILH